MPLKLKSIEEEAADCRAAFEGFPVRGFVLHCHHEQIAERLVEPAESRIVYILEHKEPEEQALRLRLFRPVPEEILKSHPQTYTDCQKADAEWQKAFAEWQKAYADCQKADADWRKTDAEWQKAFADWRKTDAEWQKAFADYEKACTVLGNLVHGELCHDCPWDGHTIFSTL